MENFHTLDFWLSWKVRGSNSTRLTSYLATEARTRDQSSALEDGDTSCFVLVLTVPYLLEDKDKISYHFTSHAYKYTYIIFLNSSFNNEKNEKWKTDKAMCLKKNFFVKVEVTPILAFLLLLYLLCTLKNMRLKRKGPLQNGEETRLT